MGNEAFAHAALQSGVNVVAGYPGTPSSEVIETVASCVQSGKAKGVHVEWSANEKAALELLCGASYAGARALFTCKQMGLNVAADALLSLNYVGVGGGVVLFVADDPGPISSQTEQDTRRFAAFAKVPVLDPATPEQGFEMMCEAFSLSEKYHTPVILRSTTRVCHASTYFDVKDETQARALPSTGFVRDPKWVIFPKRSYETHKEIEDRLAQIAHDFSTDETFAKFNKVYEYAGEHQGEHAGEHLGDSQIEHQGEHAGEHQGGQQVEYQGGHQGEDERNLRADKKGNETGKSNAGKNACQPRLGIIAGGVSAAYAADALSDIKTRAKKCGVQLPAYKFMQVGCAHPFPQKAVQAFTQNLEHVLVFEELDYVIEEELLKLAGKTHAKYEVLGKLTQHTRSRGENSIDDCYARLLAFFEAYGCDLADESTGTTREGALESLGEARSHFSYKNSTTCSTALTTQTTQTTQTMQTAQTAQEQGSNCPDLPSRPPVLCAGCPHRGSFYAIKRALGKREAVYCGDIGCYTLGNAAPLNTTDTCLCMGAGITMAQGFSVAEPHKKHVAFVGDSTFFASAMTGVANAVYNNHDITIVVLDNSTTAMTGGQPHPGTGVTLMHECNTSSCENPQNPGNPISIYAVLEALGVKCILQADPLNHTQAKKAASEALDFAGPSAIIYKSPCAKLAPHRKPAHIDADKCTGCKRCITEIGCPGIFFASGVAQINNMQCVGCGLCAQICLVGAISLDSKADGKVGAKTGTGAAPNVQASNVDK